jgi:epoxyqueuosine reductase QueG
MFNKEQSMQASDVKAAAKRAGADLCGIVSYDRFADLPPERNPLSISPRTRSVIVIAHRILRGALRGVEESTNFVSVYDHFGIAAPGWKYLTMSLAELGAFVEDAGFEAVPLRAGHREADKVWVDYQEMAHLAGLGETGLGGFFLTPEYGQRQRFAMLLTDAELEGDPIINPGFCKGCDACLQVCPNQAISADGKVDLEICKTCQNGVYPSQGAIKEIAGVQGSDNTPDDPLDRHAAVCGRTCVVAFEKRIRNPFGTPFRKRKVWRLDRDGEYISEEKK